MPIETTKKPLISVWSALPNDGLGNPHNIWMHQLARNHRNKQTSKLLTF